MIKIEKNIPIPVPKNEYPLSEMEVGDSFLSTKSITSYLSYFGNRHNKKFTQRKIEGGYRIWRIK